MDGLKPRGQALAEFALALPVFLLVVVALFDVGRAVFVYNGLTNAAREGARLAIVNQDKAMILDRAKAMAFGTTITTTADNAVRFYRSQPNSDDVVLNGECADIAVGCIAVVVADTTWSPITPIVGNILGPLNLQARSELAIELECPNPAFIAYATSDLCPKQP